MHAAHIFWLGLANLNLTDAELASKRARYAKIN